MVEMTICVCTILVLNIFLKSAAFYEHEKINRQISSYRL